MAKKYVTFHLTAPLAALLLFFLWTTPGLALVTLNTAVITNSGSINTIGYRIYVSPDGKVSYVDGHGSGQGQLSEKLTERFFYHLAEARPLSALPEEHCVKSVSFGTSTYLALGGDRSPDLSCPGSDKVQDLEDAIHAITGTLGIKNVLNSEGTPLPPIRF